MPSYSLVSTTNSNILNSVFNKFVKDQTLRIIHFGDSHIQGDRITSEIRSTLQKTNGDAGMGMFFPYSLCGSFGPTGTQSKISGTFSHSTFLKPKNRNIGLMGYEITMEQGARFQMNISDKFRGQVTNQLKIWVYASCDSLPIRCDMPYVKDVLKKQVDENLYVLTVVSEKPIDTIDFTSLTNISLWGFEYVNSNKGISYQTSGLVGAQFTHLIQHEKYFENQLKDLNPNVFIFSYGTNEAYAAIDSIAYSKAIRGFLTKLKNQFPSVPIVLSSCPDTRSSGRTPPSQKLVNSILANISTQLGCCFFDLNTAMGGWGSLYSWSKNEMVLTDKLHFNAKGGALLGKLFLTGVFSEFLNASVEYENYENDLKQTMSQLLISTKTEQNEKSTKTESTHYTKHTSKKHVVKSGETLSSISRKTGTSVKQLMKLNKLKNTVIHPGQILYY